MFTHRRLEGGSRRGGFVRNCFGIGSVNGKGNIILTGVNSEEHAPCGAEGILDGFQVFLEGL